MILYHLKRLILFSAILNIVFSPLASAQAQMTSAERSRMQQYRNFLEPLGYEMNLDMAANKAYVYDQKTKKLAMEIPFSSEGELKKFAPRSFNEMMLEEMSRIKASNRSAWSHSVKNLPAESAMFFMAMGAVIASSLITNYAQNPVALEQHIEHSLSPLGVFGFFTFMYSQGVTANVLSMYIKNPKFHHMIPYLGMTVGAFLQTYLSSVASDPNVKACAKTMIGQKITQKDLEAGVDQDPCSKAYEYLVLNKKIWEFAPGIASMLISAAMAGVGQAAISKAVLRMTGVNIALWLTPGSMQLKGIRLLLVKGIQITAFVAIDMWINRHVIYAWKNMYDGADFYTINDQLNLRINTLKKDQWAQPSDELLADLKDFREKMTTWRMTNMSDVYEAHQNWSKALQQLTSMYNASYHFYDSFISELRNSRFQETDLRLLERTYPYYGVSAQGLTEGRDNLYYLRPNFVEPLQEDTIATAVQAAQAALQTREGSSLYKHERQSINDILKLLSGTERDEKAKGLQKLEDDSRMAMQNSATSFGYRYVLVELRKILGNASPKMGIGHGFAATYATSPENSEVVKGTSYYRQVGRYMTPQISDYFVMQMVCGPDVDKGEAVIRNSLGFPSVFLPPQIKRAQDEFQSCASYGAPQLRADFIYSHPLKTDKGSYQGFADYLIKEARPSIVGIEDTENFANWWKTKTEDQILKAFEEYSKQYEEIVAKLVSSIFKEDKSVLNGRPLIRNPVAAFKTLFNSEEQMRYVKGGPVFNGALKSALQEQRLYFAVLQDLLKPSSSFKVNLEELATKAPTHPALLKVEKEFFALNDLLKRIKVTEHEKRPTVSSDLENYELEDQLTVIQAALKDVGAALGVSDGDENTVVEAKLNPAQHKVAVQVLENLQGLASEVMMYGTISNAVSWEKIRNTKRISIEQERFNNEIQARLAQIRGAAMPGAK